MKARGSRFVVSGPQRAAAIVLAAAGMLGGCDSSGFPRFVKISPDGRFVIYEDARHSKVYVHDTVTEQRRVFDGRAGCMNRDASLLVIRGDLYKPQLTCCLITIAADGVREAELPDLPLPGGIHPCLMFVDDGPGLLALLYPARWSDAPSSCRRLPAGGSAWLPADIPPTYRRDEAWRHPEPAGDRLSGHVYSPRDKGFRLPEAEEQGLDIQESVEQGEWVLRLTSPDGRYVVSIRDPHDPWHRVWLTETATGRRLLLLDKNDAAYEVLSAIVNFPGGLLMALLGPRI